MPLLTIDGPVVPADAHNVVLRDALLHSPVDRSTSATAYHLIRVGVREGAYTSWVGAWDQRNQKVDAASPLSVLDTSRVGMRLRAGQTIVVEITAEGCPDSIEGARLTFTLALVGGRTGGIKPLVAAGSLAVENGARTAIATLERQINKGGLSEWDDAVALRDPVPLVVTGTFQGRIARTASSQIKLQRYSGNWVDVDGVAVSIGSSGIGCFNVDGLLGAGGVVSSTAPSTSTLYHVYVGSPPDGSVQLRLCATAPTAYNGAYYLGTGALTRRWRFCGWVRTDGSTEFTDTTTNRLVVNYHNRLRKEIVLKPGYGDADSATTYTSTSTTWEVANAGSGATASWIANGEDNIHIVAFGRLSNSGANVTRIGIGENSTTSASTQAIVTGTTAQSTSCSYITTPSAGYRTLVLLVSVSAGTGTYAADDARNGSDADPVLTGLYASVLV